MKSLALYSLIRALINRQFDGWDGPSIRLPYAQVSRRHTVKFEYSDRVDRLELEIKKLQLELKALKKREEAEGIAVAVDQSSILTITPVTKNWGDQQIEALEVLIEDLALLGEVK